MAAYFASDVHLRLDHPERDRRFARFVDGLGPEDTLAIVGDLCDFWFAARQAGAGLSSCAGLQALASYRSRGGSITILPGNHDAWLEPAYQRAFGVGFQREPLTIEVFGLRVLLVHGHMLGARPTWKKWMESRAFLDAFRRIPRPMANGLDHLLDWTNELDRESADRRHLAVYRQFVAEQTGAADIVVLGHIHCPLDEADSRPRMIVLGGWHKRASYLKIDASGPTLINDDRAAFLPNSSRVET